MSEVRPWGKIVGGIAGLFMGGPIGAAVGVVLGHSFDSGLGPLLIGSDLDQLQQSFFQTLFRMIGYLAKSDGRVSEQEVAYTEQLMTRMGLGQEARRRAIILFNQGKEPGFDWMAELHRFARISSAQPQLRRLFLEILIDCGLADGRLRSEARRILNATAQAFQVPPAELEAMLGGRRREPGVSAPDPYSVLNVSSGASMAEIKTAYRRLISRHHPDKLVARGLPKEMMQVAEAKTREIRAAYDQIRKERGT